MGTTKQTQERNKGATTRKIISRSEVRDTQQLVQHNQGPRFKLLLSYKTHLVTQLLFYHPNLVHRAVLENWGWKVRGKTLSSLEEDQDKTAHLRQEV